MFDPGVGELAADRVDDPRMVGAVDGDHVVGLLRGLGVGADLVDGERLEAEPLDRRRQRGLDGVLRRGRSGTETISITAKWPPRIVIRESSMLPSTPSSPRLIAATIPGRSRPMALTAKWPTRLRYAPRVGACRSTQCKSKPIR